MNGERIPVVFTESPFRTAYGPRERVQVDTSVDPVTGEELGSNVKQSFRDEVDVNNIITRFRATGVLPEGSRVVPAYLDVSDMPSFQDALHHVRAVTTFFESQSAEVRAAFGNDPAFFADWMADPANREEVERYGMEAASAGAGRPVGDVDPKVDQAPDPAP